MKKTKTEVKSNIVPLSIEAYKRLKDFDKDRTKRFKIYSNLFKGKKI